ncbi:MAG: class I SAM-dependent methyltransferase [Chromatiales bacterium]|jgi:SAM-dependent methyltransferase|nr:class I SAM-dependent methyltransferase [Chromatiales bacterium]
MSNAANTPPIELPTGWLKGLIPTMNDTGFMFEVLDDYALDFIRYSGECDSEVLELGCAYGVATILALEAGAKVRACDIDQRHLDILLSRVPDGLEAQLKTELQHLPDAHLPDNQFAAILCSRVFHFLTGDEIDASLANMFRWLKPGGRLYLIADTPYGIWRNFIPVWDANHEQGVRWPGYMSPLLEFLPYKPSGDHVGPPFMNLMSPELLTRACEEAGFITLRADWIARNDFTGSGQMDGRENCGIIAVKPE